MAIGFSPISSRWQMAHRDAVARAPVRPGPRRFMPIAGRSRLLNLFLPIGESESWPMRRPGRHHRWPPARRADGSKKRTWNLPGSHPCARSRPRHRSIRGMTSIHKVVMSHRAVRRVFCQGPVPATTRWGTALDQAAERRKGAAAAGAIGSLTPIMQVILPPSIQPSPGDTNSRAP